MPELQFTLKPLKSKKLNRFGAAFDSNLKRGFERAGLYLDRELKRSLSGPGRQKGSTEGPISRLNSAPGVRTGRLRSSVSFRIKGSGHDSELRVGPNAGYGKFLEFGTRKMQPYPFIRPAWKNHAGRIVQIIQDQLMSPVHGV